MYSFLPFGSRDISTIEKCQISGVVDLSAKTQLYARLQDSSRQLMRHALPHTSLHPRPSHRFVDIRRRPICGWDNIWSCSILRHRISKVISSRIMFGARWFAEKEGVIQRGSHIIDENYLLYFTPMRIELLKTAQVRIVAFTQHAIHILPVLNSVFLVCSKGAERLAYLSATRPKPQNSSGRCSTISDSPGWMAT
jgi:hypothetical protein